MSNSTGVPVKSDRVTNLVPAEVKAMEARPSLSHLSDLYPDELEHVVHAVDGRKAEFATARVLARLALAELGVPPQSICPHADRAPAWPDGIVGSITHDAELCAVAVARTTSLRGIGLDVVHEPLEAKLRARICTETELRWVQSHDPELWGVLSMLIFSAKESFYKCQYPLTKTFLNFSDVELEFDESNQSFVATVLRDFGLARREASLICGAYFVSPELTVTVAFSPLLA